MQGGWRQIAGTITFDGSYPTGGETCDMSAYFLSTATPVILPGGDDGYRGETDRGTAAANKMLLRQSSDTNTASMEVPNATNTINVIIPFFAVGQAP
jgi:hypothetical protein